MTYRELSCHFRPEMLPHSQLLSSALRFDDASYRSKRTGTPRSGRNAQLPCPAPAVDAVAPRSENRNKLWQFSSSPDVRSSGGSISTLLADRRCLQIDQLLRAPCSILHRCGPLADSVGHGEKLPSELDGPSSMFEAPFAMVLKVRKCTMTIHTQPTH